MRSEPSLLAPHAGHDIGHRRNHIKRRGVTNEPRAATGPRLPARSLVPRSWNRLSCHPYISEAARAPWFVRALLPRNQKPVNTTGLTSLSLVGHEAISWKQNGYKKSHEERKEGVRLWQL